MHNKNQMWKIITHKKMAFEEQNTRYLLSRLLFLVSLNFQKETSTEYS